MSLIIEMERIETLKLIESKEIIGILRYSAAHLSLTAASTNLSWRMRNHSEEKWSADV